MLHRAIIFVLQKEHFILIMLSRHGALASVGSGQANAT